DVSNRSPFPVPLEAPMWLRRLFVVFSIFAVSVVAQAQQAGKIARGGVLGGAPPSGLLGFRNGLGDLGWVEGQNMAIEYRPHENRNDFLPSLAAELVQLKADVILAPGTAAALTAKQVTKTTPIVMLSSDPVGSGIVASLARPGGNVT